MMKKNLLLIVPNLKQGGFQRVCVRTARLLQEHFQVSVLIFDGEEIAYDMGETPVININVKAQRGIFNKVKNVYKRIKAIRKIKNENDVDIAYSFGMSANLVNCLTKTKSIIWCGIRSYVDLNTTSIGMVCKKADKVICCSKVLEDYILKKYPDTNTITIYNPFNIQELIAEASEKIEEKDRSFLEQEGPLVVAMGREDVLKGYWHLIKAFSRVSVSDLRLCIIGNGKFEKEKQLAKELGVEKRVYFTGGKINPFCYLNYADVYVMSSIHEGFPNSLVEAMALEVPVISANCETGPREILAVDYQKILNIKELCEEEYGILIPAMNEIPNYDSNVIEEEELILADAMSRLLENKILYEEYRKKAAGRAGEFGTQKYIEAFVELAR